MSGSRRKPVKAKLKESTTAVTVSSGRVGVRRWSGSDTGQAELPLVLLHGFTGSSESWRPVAEQLCVDRDVIAIDVFGHGATDVALTDRKRGFEDFSSAL